MEYIVHRINTIEELMRIPLNYGVELDLRDNGGDIIISHDPFRNGDCFEDYLKVYRHGTMILNVKSERIEYRIIELLKKYNVTNYFFLDSSFPMIFSLVMAGEKRIALRYSEFEGMDTLDNMKGLVEWVWVDCFTKLPLDNTIYRQIKSMGYKLCLVSPELQGHPERIEVYQRQLKTFNVELDAVCTKEGALSKWIDI